MENGKLYASELSTTRHIFRGYHFCRGNSSRRKTRIGVILKGSGAYIYLDKKLNVKAGDVVFIPESIYCYSEWNGDPEIEVIYLSCFLHYEGIHYGPQVLCRDEGVKSSILQIHGLLSQGPLEELEAYSLFYRLLQTVLPQLVRSGIAFDKTLRTAVEYITDNWNRDFSVADLAKACCVSESTVYHLFRRELGQSPVHFLNSIRINMAIEYLENTPWPVSEVSRKVCFRSENHFRKIFAEYTGMTPLQYRKGGRTAGNTGPAEF